MAEEWEQRLQDLVQRHPNILEQLPEEDQDEEYILSQKLRIAQSFIKFRTTYAFVDLVIELERIKDEALNTMMLEEAERVKSDGYRSDAQLKGVVILTDQLKLYMAQKAEEYSDLRETLDDFQKNNK